MNTLPEAKIVPEVARPGFHFESPNNIKVLGGSSFKVLCPYCQGFHYHGGIGERASDCGRGSYNIVR